MKWSVCYKRAIGKDGTLLFPEKLSKEFLQEARKTMGSYMFANQYQNETIPLEDQIFKEEWKKHWKTLPTLVYSFAFVDPAISEADTADFTAITVVSVDTEKNWYVRLATRLKCNPSYTIEYLFRLQEEYKCVSIGIEDVAFQKALIHFCHEEMRRRGKMIPVTGVKRGPDKTKDMRILGLVPRLEFGTLFLAQGLDDLESELSQFPRGAHDDLLDALASINDIVYYPTNKRSRDEKPHSPQDPAYEAWIIRNAHKPQRYDADSE